MLCDWIRNLPFFVYFKRDYLKEGKGLEHSRQLIYNN